MLLKKETVNRAVQYAEKGFLCSEAVLLALSEAQNITSEIIPRIATGFGAGISRQGEVCGALSGAIMGLGLRFGRSQVSETPQDTSPYQFGQTMVNLFASRFGHIRCRDILDLDISSDEGVKRYREQNLWESKCRELIRITTELAYDLLRANPSDSKD
ncbi:MAG: C-GCAxxG-C-C family protein [Candidatus Hermodarchaeota archaeon]